jgi:hypothetical protein
MTISASVASPFGTGAGFRPASGGASG